jgi:hypothetical protein
MSHRIAPRSGISSRFGAALVAVSIGALAASNAQGRTVYTDRASFEAALAQVERQDFDGFESDEDFDGGAIVDLGAFTLQGFGDAGPFNRIDAAPFESTGSLNGSTALAARVCDSSIVSCSVGFTIAFGFPIAAFGADFGAAATAFRISADGEVVGSPPGAGFFGFIEDAGGSVTTITIDTPTEFGGAETAIDDFVFAAAGRLTFDDRAAWEAHVGAFDEETFDGFSSDQDFDAGAVVDLGPFSLQGFGDAGPFNRIDAPPFESIGSLDGTTDVAARVCESDSLPCSEGFTITFSPPIVAWGATWGATFASFQILADGVPVGFPGDNAFFGFAKTDGVPVTTITVTTPAEFGGATTVVDDFVFALPEPAVALQGAAALLALALRARRRSRVAGAQRQAA